MFLFCFVISQINLIDLLYINKVSKKVILLFGCYFRSNLLDRVILCFCWFFYWRIWYRFNHDSNFRLIVSIFLVVELCLRFLPMLNYRRGCFFSFELLFLRLVLFRVHLREFLFNFFFFFENNSLFLNQYLLFMSEFLHHSLHLSHFSPDFVFYFLKVAGFLFKKDYHLFFLNLWIRCLKCLYLIV